MTSKEYIQANSKVINNHLQIGPISDDGPYCVECFERDGEIVKAPFVRDRNCWVCPKGHVGTNEPLARGGFA